jgi:hypothetical protein
LAQDGRNAAGETATAPGNHHGVQLGEVFEQFQGDGAVARHDVRVIEGVDEGGVHAGPGAGLEAMPPIGEGRQDDASAEAFDGAEFGGGRGIGGDDGGGHADAAGAERYALRHIAGGGGEHAAFEELARGSGHHIGGAADLERADGLEVFQFEGDFGGRIGEAADERGAQGDTGDVGTGFGNLGESDGHLTIVHETAGSTQRRRDRRESAEKAKNKA